MSKKIVDYEILGENTIRYLEHWVKRYIAMGWTPHGSLVVNREQAEPELDWSEEETERDIGYFENNHFAKNKRYLQAMVKYETDEEELDRKEEQKELEEEQKEAERNKKRFYNEKV